MRNAQRASRCDAGQAVRGRGRRALVRCFYPQGRHDTLARFWSEYAVHGGAWFQQHIHQFPTQVSVVNALLWVLAEIIAGSW